MEPLSLGQVVTSTGGQLLGSPADPNGEIVRRVSTDSRWIRPGDLFVCLEGPRFDGHAFAREAVEDGAVAILAHRDVEVDVPAIRVEDTTVALGRLGRYVRDGALGSLVVGVTGTNGKTSTKDLTAAALEVAFTTVASERSYNNTIGVPRPIIQGRPLKPPNQ